MPRMLPKAMQMKKETLRRTRDHPAPLAIRLKEGAQMNCQAGVGDCRWNQDWLLAICSLSRLQNLKLLKC